MIFTHMYCTPCECFGRAQVGLLSICFLKHTRSFPPILLVVKLEGCSVGGGDEVIRSSLREASKVLPKRFRLKKVTSSNLNCTVCLVMFRDPLDVYSPIRRR